MIERSFREILVIMNGRARNGCLRGLMHYCYNVAVRITSVLSALQQHDISSFFLTASHSTTKLWCRTLVEAL